MKATDNNEQDLTYKDILNAIWRLRLLYNTEKELSDHVGHKLKGNGFKLKPKEKDEDGNKFQYKAYFNQLSLETKVNEVNLKTLLFDYRETDRFCQENNIAIKKLRSDKENRWLFLDLILENEISNNKTMPKRISNLYKKYKSNNKENQLGSAILLLLILGLIPTYNRGNGEIENIIKDFQLLIDEVIDYFINHLTKYILILDTEDICERLTKMLLENYDITNRIELINVTHVFLNIFSLIKTPEGFREIRNILSATSATFIDGLWEVIKGNGKEFYELETNNNFSLLLKHYTFECNKKGTINKDREYIISLIKNENNKYFYTISHGSKNLIFDTISFHETGSLPKGYIDFGYLSIDKDKNNNELILMFNSETPLGEAGFTLKTSPVITKRYQPYLNEYNKRRENANNYFCEPIYPYFSRDHIIFNLPDDNLYQLDKKNEDGTETVPGITTMNTDDTIIYKEYMIDGHKKKFITLSPLKPLNLDDLLKEPYFKKIEDIKDLS
ncbi:hypothetical protein NXV05_00430 [Parabacteroides johnsonii]|nr:hypothetical protein [Parabacteroides johnsonii]